MRLRVRVGEKELAVHAELEVIGQAAAESAADLLRGELSQLFVGARREVRAVRRADQIWAVLENAYKRKTQSAKEQGIGGASVRVSVRIEKRRCALVCM